MRNLWGRTFLAAIALSLAACGDTIKFPGFDNAVEEPVSDPVADPDPTTDPVTEPDPIPDPDPISDPVDEPETDPVTDPDPGPIEDPIPEPEPTFSYYPAGNILAGSGQGSPSQTIFAPDMLFPVESAPTIVNSQVFLPGGSVFGGDQCDPSNYEPIWRDNFCEHRSRFSTPYCPGGEGVHLGLDLRVGTVAECKQLRDLDPKDRTLHKIVAVEDGEITNIGRYTVTLKAGGRIYRYLHLNMRALQVSAGDTVEAGDHIGYYSNDFGGTPTTFHLHFEIKVNDGVNGWVFAPPYTSMLEAYARREGNPGKPVEALVGVASAETPIVIPEGAIIRD